MNKRRIYSLRDLKLNEYNPPCVFGSDAAAVRAFGDMIRRDKESIVSVHRDDFALCFVGFQDSETGVLEPVQPVQIATGSSFADE